MEEVIIVQLLFYLYFQRKNQQRRPTLKVLMLSRPNTLLKTDAVLNHLSENILPKFEGSHDFQKHLLSFSLVHIS